MGRVKLLKNPELLFGKKIKKGNESREWLTCFSFKHAHNKDSLKIKVH